MTLWKTLQNKIEESKPCTVFSLMLPIVAVMHFGLPLAITYDTGHYHSYLPIFQGSESLESWDRARQPGYPLFLWIIRNIIGSTQQGVLLVHFALLGGSLWLALQFVWTRSVQVLPRTLALAFITFFILLDPIVVGYFHVLLTECLAASIFSFSTFFAVNWIIKYPERGRNLKWLGSTLAAWIFLIVFSYHVKQSYVLCALIPFFVAIVISSLYSRNKVSLITLTAASTLVVATLGASIAIWNSILPPNHDAYMLTREPATIGANMLIAGVVRSQPLGTLAQVSEMVQNQQGAFSQQEARQIQNAAANKNLDPNCSSVRRIGLNTDSPLVVLKCNERSPTGSEALSYIVRAFVVAPHEVTRGYIEGSLRMMRILPSGVVKGSGEYEIMLESEAVGFMPFRAPSNIAWMPDSLGRGVSSYYQQDLGNARGIFGRLPYKWFRGQAIFVFSAVLLILQLSFFVVAIWLFKNYRNYQAKPLPAHLVFLVTASLTTLGLFALHSGLGMVIDRYAFPSYFVGVLCLCVFIPLLFNRKRSPLP